MRIVKKTVQNKNWRKIYEVIDTDYIQKTNIFPNALSQNVN